MEQPATIASTKETSLNQSARVEAAARGNPGQKFRLNTAIGIMAAIAALYFGREVLMPIALALLLSFLLAPLMLRVQRIGLGKTGAAFTIVVLLFIVASLVGWMLLGQLYSLAIELPHYRQNIHAKWNSVTPNGLSRLGRARELIGEVTGDLAPTPGKAPANTRLPQKAEHPVPVEVREPEPTPFQLLKNAAGSVLEPLATAFIVVIFVVFMLLSREDLRDRVLRLAGSGRLYVTTQLLDDAARRVSRYLRMQLAVNALYGTLVGIGLLVIGIPHALVWAVMAMLLRFVPYVGAWIAAAGPLLLAVAVAPGWSKFLWTLGLYSVLEFLAANVAEPLLYGSLTGISSLAILVAATFWTWLWGPVGLLLSTPLTVCLVVMGRYIPHLEFLGIIFGDEPVLSPAQRFYQRMIAMDAEDAAELVEDLVAKGTLAEVFDDVIIPAMTLVEEGRHAGFLDSAVEQYILENTRELVEDLGTKNQKAESSTPLRIICVPARDSADGIAAEMFAQLMPKGVETQVLAMAASVSTRPIIEFENAIAAGKPDLVCVSGIPPGATRQVALRCKHLRRRFPDLTIMAAVWSTADLASIRSRIPVGDANHVVCTLRQALEYVSAISNPAEMHKGEAPPRIGVDEQRAADADIAQQTDIPLQEALDKITQGAAKTLDAPIAVLSLTDENGRTWESHCGVSADLDLNLDTWFLPLEGQPNRSGTTTIVIEDIKENDRLAQNPFLQAQGIHFYANAWLVGRNGKSIGSLRILDTRPRKLNQSEKDLLTNAAGSAVEALDVRTVTPASEQGSPDPADVPATQQTR
jgi:predicted PurR-regulated permease PerM